jgi:hypothetical protein
MTWFETLMGFSEESPEQVRGNITFEGSSLASQVNGKVFICGKLETPSLAQLREYTRDFSPVEGEIVVREVVADLRDVLQSTVNSGALFQVASQFNLLEMASPDITPEHGIGIYESDHTQGPACSIAAGAGTIYRNYFANVDDQVGQSASNQIDCIADLGVALGNTRSRLWEMRNGYALASEKGLHEISARLQKSSEDEVDALRQLLRIGIQWNTQVTLCGSTHNVSQAYCSALPVSYSKQSSNLWSRFALLILEASYEATLCAAILNSERNGSNKVFLTTLGGGVFGNDMTWILEAIQRALTLYKHLDLDVTIVSYGSSNPRIQHLVSRMSDF